MTMRQDFDVVSIITVPEYIHPRSGTGAFKQGLIHLIEISLLAFCSIASIVLLLCREIFVTTSYAIPIENIILLVTALTFNLYTIVFFIASVHYREEFVCSWNATQLIKVQQIGLLIIYFKYNNKDTVILKWKLIIVSESSTTLQNVLLMATIIFCVYISLVPISILYAKVDPYHSLLQIMIKEDFAFLKIKGIYSVAQICKAIVLFLNCFQMTRTVSQMTAPIYRGALALCEISCDKMSMGS